VQKRLTHAGYPQPVRLEWQLMGEVREAVLEAARAAEALCADLDLQVACVQADCTPHPSPLPRNPQSYTLNPQPSALSPQP